VLVVFSLLLTSADAIFGRALDEAFRFPFDVDGLARRGSFALLAAVFVGGPLAIALGILNAAGWPLLLTPEPRTEELAPRGPRSGATEVLKNLPPKSPKW
jgi:hypothetical protein